ncbi:hypothetical protein MTO96_044009, partial [Rhipicephalus appendiculatus]
MFCCEANKDDAATTLLDSIDSEVKEFFRKGVQLEHGNCSQDCLASMWITHGAKLKYKKTSKKEAVMLRRLLSTGLPVRTLSLCDICLSAFSVAFHELHECPSLEKLHLHVDCKGKDFATNLSTAFRSLSTLELSCENTGKGFAKAVADYIRENKSLREIAIWNSCGGDEGAIALLHALAANDTLKTFTLADVGLASDALFGFAMMLANNTTLEVVNLKYVFPVHKDKVCWLMAQERYAGVFKRLDILWPEELLPELSALIRRQACFPALFVSVSSFVNEGVIREFSDAVAADTRIRGLVIESDMNVVDALQDMFDAGGTAFARRKIVLRQIWRDRGPNRGKHSHLVPILDALKRNRSIEQFVTWSAMVTQEMATSLSESLAVNDKLNVLHVYNYWEISPDEIQTILKGLRANCTLTDLRVLWDADHCEGMLEVDALLQINVALVKKAAHFVVSGTDLSDVVTGADVLKKLKSSARLVQE